MNDQRPHCPRFLNRLIALAILSITANLSSAFPSILLVWNAVALEPTPSKSRLRSGDGTEIGFLWWTEPIIGAYSDVGWGYTLRSSVKAAFILSRRGRRVRAPCGVDTPIRLRVEIPVPVDRYPPIPTPVKPFNVPPDSSAVTQSDKSKIFSSMVVLQNPNRTSSTYIGSFAR